MATLLGSFPSAAPVSVYVTTAPGVAKAGATSGWVVAPADDTALVTLPASKSASTLVIPIRGLKVGWTITGIYLIGQIESAGGTVTANHVGGRIGLAARRNLSQSETTRFEKQFPGQSALPLMKERREGRLQDGRWWDGRWWDGGKLRHRTGRIRHQCLHSLQ